MTDLRLDRTYAIDSDRLWDFVTTPEGLRQWWGPEGLTVPEDQLDFRRPGPWFSVMLAPDGTRFHVSGKVTDVNPKTSVTFTWAWHDESGVRGHESRVTLTVEPLGPGRARLRIDHLGLPDDEAGLRHEQGWASTLRKLECLTETV